MHCSIFTACLVLFVAVSTVSAQWGGRDCLCNGRDTCVDRNGRLVCQVVGTTNDFYAPLGSDRFVGETVLGRRQVLNTGLGRVGRLNSVGVNQRLVNQRRVNQRLVNPRLVNQRLVNQAALGQSMLSNGVVGAGFLGANSLLSRTECCQSSDYTNCLVGNAYTGLARYIGTGVCKKFYFNGRECVRADMYSDCVKFDTPNNYFEDQFACENKCLGTVGGY